MAGPRAHHGLRHEPQADPAKDRRAPLPEFPVPFFAAPTRAAADLEDELEL